MSGEDRQAPPFGADAASTPPAGHALTPPPVGHATAAASATSAASTPPIASAAAAASAMSAGSTPPVASVPAPSSADDARACAPCLRRARLLALVAGGIEVAHRQRRPIREVLALPDETLMAAVSRDDDLEALRAQLAASSTDELLAAAQAAGLGVLCRHRADYPARLADDPSSPAALFVAGGEDPRARLTQLVGGGLGEPAPPAVAIVGTRRASAEGLEIARSLGRGLAAAGVTVVSGMALGVDSAAHAGALDVGGPTVAVLAGGADVPYPASKRRLYADILAAGGVAVSELPPGFRAFKWNFPARNRIIAALAPVTIVVEAAERSGSLITAELALDLGRDVGAVPGPVLSWRSRGTNALLRDGATLIRNAHDALDLVLGVDAAREAILHGARTAPHRAPEQDRGRRRLARDPHDRSVGGRHDSRLPDRARAPRARPPHRRRRHRPDDARDRALAAPARGAPARGAPARGAPARPPRTRPPRALPPRALPAARRGDGVALRPELLPRLADVHHDGRVREPRTLVDAVGAIVARGEPDRRDARGERGAGELRGEGTRDSAAAVALQDADAADLRDPVAGHGRDPAADDRAVGEVAGQQREAARGQPLALTLQLAGLGLLVVGAERRMLRGPHAAEVGVGLGHGDQDAVGGGEVGRGARQARHHRQPRLDGEAARDQRRLDRGRGRRQVLQPRHAIASRIGVGEGRDLLQRRPGADVGDRVAQVLDGAVRVERGGERADALDLAVTRGGAAQVLLELQIQRARAGRGGTIHWVGLSARRRRRSRTRERTPGAQRDGTGRRRRWSARRAVGGMGARRLQRPRGEGTSRGRRRRRPQAAPGRSAGSGRFASDPPARRPDSRPPLPALAG
jgi:DNA processing protein